MRNDCKGDRRLCLRLPTGHRIGRPPAPLRRAAPWLLPAAAFVAAVFAMPAAHAQLGASAALVSDYSVRGMTLSQGRPEPQLRVDYDTSSGWYAGALASGAALAGSDASLQLIAYGGYARRLRSGLSWEAGLLDANFAGDASYRYHEFYAGLAREGISARVYFSPAYYGETKTVYTELNAAWPLRDHLTLNGHVGMLHPFGDGDEEARRRVDLRLALGMDYGDLNLQLALVAAAPAGRAAARRLAFDATWNF